VREIVLAHDGTIDLASRAPPPGLVVTVCLPAAAADQDARKTSP
jgi:signal transduction histidine kinase